MPPDIIKALNEIFSNQIFQVPDYQRGYAWGLKQWNDLLEDLELLPKDRSHFTGTIVLRNSANGADRVIDRKGRAHTSFDIIDGQQRLTTIVILLKTIHEQMGKLPGFEDLADGLREMYLHQKDIDDQTFTKLSLNQDSQTYFANNILDLSPGISGPEIRSHQLLSQARNHFTTYLEAKRDELGEEFPAWLRELYFKVVYQLSFIVYPVEDELDAGVIFETMNDRGKDLTELELVKNYLLYVSSKLELSTAHDLNHRINVTWKHIYQSLMAAGLSGREREDQLLRAHWLMAYDHDTRRWKNNRSIKAQFSLRDYQGRHPELLSDLKAYLDSLGNAATAYCDILNPDRDGAFNDLQGDLRRQAITWSSKLARLGVRASFLPILMAVRLDASKDPEAYLKIVQLCEKFNFRIYQWMAYRSNTGESTLYRLGHEYYQAPDPQWLGEELSRAILDYCPDQRFQERFTKEDENWYRWGGITYFLFEYEHHLAGGRRIDMEWETIDARPKAESVEHILPQSAEHPYWRERFASQEHKRWVHDIGNLTLTFDNSSLSNRSFPNKKGRPGEIGRYAGSPLFVERQLASYDEWNEQALRQRRTQIREWALERWYVEPPPPRPITDESTIEHMLAVAEQNRVGEEFQALHEAAEKLQLNARVRKSIQYRPPFDWTLSTMTVQIHPGHFWIYFRLHNFAKYPGVTGDQVDELLPYKNRDWTRIEAAETKELVACLEALYELVKDELEG